MKIICLQEKLKKAIGIVERITGKNINLPILSNVLLETEKGRLKISATDLELGLNVWVSAKVEKEGRATVPVNILSKFISSLPQDKIFLEAKKNNLVVECQDFKADIKGLKPDDFPIIPKIEDKPFLTLSAQELYQSLSQVYQAASFSDTRPEIAGVFFKLSQNGTLRLVATDSFRLAEKTLKKVTKEGKGKAIIIPIKAVVELIRILDNMNGEVKLTIKDNQLLFDMGDVRLVSRLIEGRFPDYERIIPQEFITEVTLEKDSLVEAIRIASYFVSKVNDVNFHFSPQGKLEISSGSQEVGFHNSSLKADIQGENLSLTFNYRYVLDGLNNIDNKKARISLHGKEKPLLLRGLNDKSYLYIVMPVRDTE